MNENSPHDDLFKITFSMPSEMEAFLNTYLPLWLSEDLDYQTLKKESDSFANEKLQEYFSDVVYCCQWKNSSKTCENFFFTRTQELRSEEHFCSIAALFDGSLRSPVQTKRSAKPCRTNCGLPWRREMDEARFCQLFRPAGQTI